MSFSFSASVASRPAVLKRGSFASRARARTACRASALPQKGKTALTGVLRVPTASEAAFDELWASHEKMMNATHVVGNAEASDEGHPRLLEYYVSKAVELTDPFDPGAPRRDRGLARSDDSRFATHVSNDPRARDFYDFFSKMFRGFPDRGRF
jgi:hypothetical protein